MIITASVRRIPGLKSWLLIGALLALAVPATAMAAAQYFYPLKANLQTGMLVSVAAQPQVVEAASDRNSKNLVGVLEPTQNSGFSDAKPGQVAVATDGVAQALVSNIGGDIKVGDRIMTSNILGAGQKSSRSGWIIGIAQASFDAKTKTAVKQSFDTNGQKQTVYIGTIPVLVKVLFYNNSSAATDENSPIPAPIRRLATTIAGKPVSTIAIIASGTILILAFIIAGFVIYGSVRGSFISVGRNPLSKAVITRGLLLTFAIGAGFIAAAILTAVILLHSL